MYNAGRDLLQYILLHYGGKWGLSHCCFNGPTSRNVVGYIFGCLM